MKYRSDFVTNSSSSSFILSIRIETKDDEVAFYANGGTPESGRIDYFENDAIVTVSPKQMGTAKTVEEMIAILTEGVVDGYDWYGEEPVKIFAESNPQNVIDYGDEAFDWDNMKNVTVDAYDFIEAIRENVHSMDDIVRIIISGQEINYMEYIQEYTYNRQTNEYTGYVSGYEFEKDGASGGEIMLRDLNECDIEYDNCEE